MIIIIIIIFLLLTLSTMAPTEDTRNAIAITTHPYPQAVEKNEEILKVQLKAEENE